MPTSNGLLSNTSRVETSLLWNEGVCKMKSTLSSKTLNTKEDKR